MPKSTAPIKGMVIVEHPAFTTMSGMAAGMVRSGFCHCFNPIFHPSTSSMNPKNPARSIETNITIKSKKCVAVFK